MQSVAKDTTFCESSSIFFSSKPSGGLLHSSLHSSGMSSMCRKTISTIVDSWFVLLRTNSGYRCVIDTAISRAWSRTEPSICFRLLILLIRLIKSLKFDLKNFGSVSTASPTTSRIAQAWSMFPFVPKNISWRIFITGTAKMKYFLTSFGFNVVISEPRTWMAQTCSFWSPFSIELVSIAVIWSDLDPS